MKFKIQSKFKPTGDQPEAIKKIVRSFASGKKFQTLLGVTGSGKTFTMANVIEKLQKPTLILVHNKTLAAQLASELRDFFPKNAVQYFVSYYDYYQPEAYIPRTDLYIAKETQINEEIERLRHSATMSLLTRKDVIVVASVSCIYGLGSPAFYEEKRIDISKNKLTMKNLMAKLVKAQYLRNDLDFFRGTFRVIGDTLDIFPSYEENDYYKVEFFGNEVEKITQRDSLTGKILRKLDAISIFPNTHYTVPENNTPRIIKEIQSDLNKRVKYFRIKNKLLEAQRIKERTEYDLELLKETGIVSGIENYSKYIDGRESGKPPKVLLDYFPKDYLMIIDESHMTIPQVGGMYGGDKARKNILVQYGFRLPSAKDNRPLNFEEFEKHYNQVLFTSATPREYEKNKSRGEIAEQIIRPTGLLDPTVEVKPTENQIDNLIDNIKKRIDKKQRVLVTTLTKRMAEDLSEYLEELGMKVHYIHADVDTLERLEILRDFRKGVYDIVVGINLLREGLDLPEVSLVAILDADKEGYLRTDIALIQTMGRAARHKDGHVIMYADKITGSMRRAMDETVRRRKIQEAYNKKHGITPQSIIKAIRDDRLAGKKSEEADLQKIASLRAMQIKEIPSDELSRLIKQTQEQMDLAAKNLEFEKAAALRDQLNELKKSSK